MCIGKRIGNEVWRIIGPSTSRGLGYSTSNSSLFGSGQINRKPKRKAKVKFVGAPSSAKKGRLSTAKFQKKLVVFNYMGPDATDSFTRADRNIVVRGLLPPILVDASETDVRHEICEVIRSCSDFDNCGPNDFQFIDMNGKQASVPKCKSGFVWDGRAVKELVGCGSLYVRLIDDIGVLTDASSSSSDEYNLPHITVIGLGNTDEVDDPRTHASDKSPVSGHPSHSNSANVPFTPAVSIPSTSSNIMSSDNEDVTSNHASGSPGLRITYKKPDEGQELAQLAELFPAISADRLKYVYACVKVEEVCSCSGMFDGRTISGVVAGFIGHAACSSTQ